MDLGNETNPWKHQYYSQIKDMYHPFLYHNHLYCELTEERIKELLDARDSYVRNIEIRVIDIQLTNAEREWVYYLRDCCLFELHRRKYKIVLADLMRYTNENQDDNNEWFYPLPPHLKVMQWLDSTEGAYETGDFRRALDEYPERLEQDIYPDPRQHPVEIRTYAESGDEYLRVTDNKIHFIKFPPSGGMTNGRHHQDENKGETSQKGLKANTIITFQWPNSKNTKTEGNLKTDQEYVQRRVERSHELEILKKQRENARGDDTRRETEIREQNEPRHREDERVKKDLRENQQQEENGKDENGSTYSSEISQKLTPAFVKTAINTAVNTDYKEERDFPELNIPVEKLRKKTPGGFLMINFDTLGEAIDLLNKDMEIQFGEWLKKKRSELTFATSSSGGGGYYFDDVPFFEPPDDCSPPREVDNVPDLSNGVLDNSENVVNTGIVNGGYIKPGTYVVPKTDSATHLKKDGLQPIVVPENKVDDDPGKAMIKQLYPNLLPEYCEAGTSSSAPPVPEFQQSDEDTESTLSSPPSVVPSNKKQADSFGLDDNESITSDDVRRYEETMRCADLDCTIADTEPPEEFFSPSPPSISPRELDDESSISESDIIGPGVGPDYSKLPLPKTPENKKK